MTTSAASISAPVRADRLAVNWRLFAIEAALLGCFMISACSFVILIEHPASPLHAMIHSRLARRSLVGLAMGVTAIALIYSPWGKRSGALMNPAMTLCALRLGKLSPCDAVGYAIAQFAGATLGVGLMATVAKMWVAHPSVRFVATVPGDGGVFAAWLAEFAIAFLLVTVVFRSNKHPKLARVSGVFAGALVTAYITFVAPVSGMSMNPARTFGSAVWAHLWRAWWVYFTAPVLGMLLAAELQHRLSARPQRLCMRLSHSRSVPSHFTCNCLAPDASKDEP